MNGQQKPLVLLIFCAVLVGLSLLGLAGAFLTRLLRNIDGLLLLSICLMTALIFAFLLYDLAKQQGWLGKSGKDGADSPK
jgi:hypothetical protein